MNGTDEEGFVKKNQWVGWHLLSAIFYVVIIQHTAHANSLEVQRARYEQINQAWNRNEMDKVQTLMKTLNDYPLYPYLEYRQITDNLMKQPSITINNFIQNNPTVPLTRTLKSRFLNELARREDWGGLLAFSQEKPIAVEARCNYYYAKWMIGQQDEAFAGAQELWRTGKSQPHACTRLFNAWRTSGKQDALSYLERIHLAMSVGNTQLVIALATQMPENYKSISSAIIRLANNPNTVLSFADTTVPTNFTRRMSAAAFNRVACDNVENARLMIPHLVQAQQLNEDQTQELCDIVAWKLMGNNVPKEQARWRDRTIMHSRSTSLIEQRVRMALGSGDHNGLNIWLARLPMAAKEKYEWQYWRANLLLKNGYEDEAKKILRSLMQQRGFYPMAAAQRLGEEYMPKINKVPAIACTLLKRSEMARVRELMYWNLDNIARNEWINLLISRSQDEKAQLARYAFNNRWWDLSVQATISGKLWDYLGERFPLAYNELFRHYTKSKEIPQSYAMAIARQESGWNPKVRSPVGARGLMQIMPGTAEHTVKMFNISGYDNPSQLLDPKTNINIGTSYLQYVYRQFNNNRILTTAAYNAGPKRVRIWLNNSAGRIDAIAFIESIPFSETRHYVKNVLTYDVYHRYFMRQNSALMSASEWQRFY